MTPGSMAAILPAMRSHLVEFVAKMQRRRWVNPRNPRSANSAKKVTLPQKRETAPFLLRTRTLRIALRLGPRLLPARVPRSRCRYGAVSGARSRLKAARIAGIGCGIGGTA